MEKDIEELKSVEASVCALLLDAWHEAAQSLGRLADVATKMGFPEFSKEAAAISGTISQRVESLGQVVPPAIVVKPLVISGVAYPPIARTLNATRSGNFSSSV